MDPKNLPFELISFSGLLKSLEDIKTGNFMKSTNKIKKSDDRIDKVETSKSTVMRSIKKTFVFSVMFVVNFIERILYFMMSTYDNYVYSPLQKNLSPIIKNIPRYVTLQNGYQLPIFTANIVTLSRTFLVVPIAWFLKYDYNFMAFLCVVFHDFLDHLDGIVAKVHRVTYPERDDPLLGGFLDAFCDKIVNVLSIWTILQFANLENASSMETFWFIIICYGVISYETLIGIVRVQDFFYATFKREYNIEDTTRQNTDSAKVTAASMEGKLKEKLESMGIAFLCLSLGNSTNPIDNFWGISGLVCLLLTLRMAHKSLSLKLIARESKQSNLLKNRANSSSADNLLHFINSNIKPTDQNLNFVRAEMKMVNFENNEISEQDSNYQYQKRRTTTLDQTTFPSITNLKESSEEIDNRVDRVYTVGCFDLFHYGHVQLINRMRKLGKKVIVGVHDGRSIFKLKKRVPIDSTEKRMLNVKSVADEVFCISGTDPSNFITCIVNLAEGETALYVRGDDMQNFPSRQVVETLMPIKFLPYTEGVSSTQLRKDKYSHIAANDLSYLEKND